MIYIIHRTSICTITVLIQVRDFASCQLAVWILIPWLHFQRRPRASSGSAWESCSPVLCTLYLYPSVTQQDWLCGSFPALQRNAGNQLHWENAIPSQMLYKAVAHYNLTSPKKTRSPHKCYTKPLHIAIWLNWRKRNSHTNAIHSRCTLQFG